MSVIPDTLMGSKATVHVRFRMYVYLKVTRELKSPDLEGSQGQLTWEIAIRISTSILCQEADGIWFNASSVISATLINYS